MQTIHDTSVANHLQEHGREPCESVNGKHVGVQFQCLHVIWWAHMMQTNTLFPSPLPKGTSPQLYLHLLHNARAGQL